MNQETNDDIDYSHIDSHVTHTKYIRDLSKQSGKSQRELEAMWKMVERQVNFDMLNEPNKYTHLNKSSGSISQEISRKLEDIIFNNPDSQNDDNIEMGDEDIWDIDADSDDTEDIDFDMDEFNFGSDDELNIETDDLEESKNIDNSDSELFDDLISDELVDENTESTDDNIFDELFDEL